MTPWQPTVQQPVAQQPAVLQSTAQQSMQTAQNRPIQIPPQTMPGAQTGAPSAPYQQWSGSSPSAALTQNGFVSGAAGFAPSASPEGLGNPITDLNQPAPMTVESLQYLNGFLRTQIGRRVQVQFLIGTNTVTDRTGTLLGVGANYILLNETDSDDLLACDFYNIKFIRFYY
jgi:outer membrane biosynthesis protein TonB